MQRRFVLTVLTILGFAPFAAIAEPAAGLSARDLGARYGQALGAVLACPGYGVTAKAEALASGLSRGEMEDFKREAAVVVGLWRRIPVCDAATNGPNECRLANDLSCREAMRDVGPEGRVVPGLIEVRP